MTRVITAFVLSLGLVQAASVADLYSPKDISGISEKLAAKHAPFNSQDLKKYGNHYTMVAYREGTGSSEVHEHEADILVVESGAADILIGGKLVDSKETKPGEFRGTSITGGEKLSLVAGSVIHIPAGVPHQMLVNKAKPITYFVVKVTGQ
jgi:mannose-6-phosphate isomerase-like protein (cupin superfamily)